MRACITEQYTTGQLQVPRKRLKIQINLTMYLAILFVSVRLLIMLLGLGNVRDGLKPHALKFGRRGSSGKFV